MPSYRVVQLHDKDSCKVAYSCELGIRILQLSTCYACYAQIIVDLWRSVKQFSGQRILALI